MVGDPFPRPLLQHPSIPMAGWGPALGNEVPELKELYGKTAPTPNIIKQLFRELMKK